MFLKGYAMPFGALWPIVAHLDSSGTPLNKRNIGREHYPVEGFDLKGAIELAISFKSPEEIGGLDTKKLSKSSMSTFQLATVTERAKRVPINIFFHAVCSEVKTIRSKVLHHIHNGSISLSDLTNILDNLKKR